MFLRALSDREIATQVAVLLNQNNQLQSKKSARDILRTKTNYITELHGKLVLGVAGIEKLNYTFTEIKHLCVREDWRRKHIGRFLVERAMNFCDTPMLYVSIRKDNKASLELFKGFGFTESGEYPSEDHSVAILTRKSPKWANLTSTSKPTSSGKTTRQTIPMVFTAES